MQLYQTILSVLSISAVTTATVQPLANDSPEDTYIAQFDGKLDGYVKFTGQSNGSIEVDVDLSGFPSTGGPFLYHVHVAPVPTDGNCTGTLGHLNPYLGNPNATSKDELEIGDLSGRYGTLDGDSKVSYIDQYLSLNESSKAFIGKRSVTVHFANNTRYACANITEVSEKPTIPTNQTDSENAAAGMKVSGAAMVVAAGMALLY